MKKGLLLAAVALGTPAWAQTCQPTALTPYLNINGTSSWVAKSSASLNAGSRVVLGPQPTSGSWSWSGCGASGSSREQTLKLTASCTATATYVNSCGARSTLSYQFNVWAPPAANAGRFIMVDQFGYLTNAKKIAVIRNPKVGFDSNVGFWPQQLRLVNSATGQIVKDNWWPSSNWNNYGVDPASGDQVLYADFSDVTAPGTYEVVDINTGERSARFEIGDNVYRNVLMQAVRMFFYQRAGQNKTVGNAGVGWADGPSHVKAGQDPEARRFLDKGNAATARDLRGGWYDAGDMNKYTSYATGYIQGLLDAYLESPAAFTDDFNIPESGNGVPDILDEVKWGMDWLVRMQNADGSVLSIVGEGGGSVPPSTITTPSYYGDASTTSTLAAAAAFAHGAKVYASLNNPALTAYAADLKRRAVSAWQWAIAHPSVLFYNDAAHGNGGLGVGPIETDDHGRDMLRLTAAIRLFALTGDATYRPYIDGNYQTTQLMKDWTLSGVNAGSARELLYYASLPGATASVANDIRSRYQSLVTRSDYPSWGGVLGQKDAYLAFIGDQYIWGSNNLKASQGRIFFDDLDYKVSGHTADEVAAAAGGYLHYLHGVNPLGKVYLSNMVSFGAENSVNRIWHSWFMDGDPKWASAATSTYGPAPGYLVGGPTNSQWSWDSGCPGVSAQCGSAPPAPPYGQPAAKSYLDFNTGWPLNSWSISEPSDGYQVSYIRLLARFVK
ncbi:glycoside hydrolase family 9 protein [Pelomonas sp. P7]|uniref:Glycoside hydrolase family 9 protein n=1 Tax=Pelomonas caseinilytica TaxID=2906763 RepID=A0ABS8X8C5_9BURK|nr:glycoside hydrolase family 9 protein [Pelomonas sp. P7]MCE4536951.1 glycoside hydrolase family 9 protein [Pelomonas sp. P7]